MGHPKIRDFTDLIVWQKSHALVLEIYRLTGMFPSEERFGLTSQMQRSAVSVSANIVEGFRRQGERNKLQFYNISEASLDELRYYLILARDLGYAKEISGITERCLEVGRLLKAFGQAAAKLPAAGPRR